MSSRTDESLTNSPWFWLITFVGFSAVLVAVAMPQMSGRQRQFDLKGESVRAGLASRVEQNRSSSVGATEVDSLDTQEAKVSAENISRSSKRVLPADFKLRSLFYLLVGLAILGGGFLFWSQRNRRTSTSNQKSESK